MRIIISEYQNCENTILSQQVGNPNAGEYDRIETTSVRYINVIKSYDSLEWQTEDADLGAWMLKVTGWINDKNRFSTIKYC